MAFRKEGDTKNLWEGEYQVLPRIGDEFCHHGGNLTVTGIVHYPVLGLVDVVVSPAKRK
ncbi:MAG: hypothetical protein RLW87_20630 [Alphaproteobacteria bacterium]